MVCIRAGADVHIEDSAQDVFQRDKAADLDHRVYIPAALVFGQRHGHRARRHVQYNVGRPGQRYVYLPQAVSADVCGLAADLYDAAARDVGCAGEPDEAAQEDRRAGA